MKIKIEKGVPLIKKRDEPNEELIAIYEVLSKIEIGESFCYPYKDKKDYHRVSALISNATKKYVFKEKKFITLTSRNNPLGNELRFWRVQ